MPLWFDSEVASLNPEGYKGTTSTYNFRSGCGHIVNCSIYHFRERFSELCKECKSIPNWFNEALNPEGYKGWDNKYNFKSQCGHVVNVIYNNFRVSYKDKCLDCKTEPIPDWFDIDLNPDGYIGSQDKYNFKSQCGHVINCSIYNFKKYHKEKCPDCKNLPDWFDKDLNPDGYIDTKHKYNFKSKCGHIVNYSIYDFKKYHKEKCPECKTTPDWFDIDLNPEGYIGSQDKYNFKSKCGHIYYGVYYDFKKYHKEKCPECKPQCIPDWFNATINSNGYIDSMTKYNFKSQCGHTYYSVSLK